MLDTVTTFITGNWWVMAWLLAIPVAMYVARWLDRGLARDAWLAFLTGTIWPIALLLWVGVKIFDREIGSFAKVDDWVAWKFRRTMIHEDEYGKLYRVENPVETRRYVEFLDPSNGKTGRLRVPRDNNTNTAKGAVAWTYEKTEKEFEPELRT